MKNRLHYNFIIIFVLLTTSGFAIKNLKEPISPVIENESEKISIKLGENFIFKAKEKFLQASLILEEKTHNSLRVRLNIPNPTPGSYSYSIRIFALNDISFYRPNIRFTLGETVNFENLSSNTSYRFAVFRSENLIPGWNEESVDYGIRINLFPNPIYETEPPIPAIELQEVTPPYTAIINLRNYDNEYNYRIRYHDIENTTNAIHNINVSEINNPIVIGNLNPHFYSFYLERSLIIEGNNEPQWVNITQAGGLSHIVRGNDDLFNLQLGVCPEIEDGESFLNDYRLYLEKDITRKNNSKRILTEKEEIKQVFIENGIIIKKFDKADLNYLKLKGERPSINIIRKKLGSYTFLIITYYSDGTKSFTKPKTIKITNKPVILYSDINGKGYREEFPIQKENLTKSWVTLNNQASSLRVFPNYEVILYDKLNTNGLSESHRNTKSICEKPTNPFQNISEAMNNKTSAVLVRKIPNAVNFYTEDNFKSMVKMPHSFKEGIYTAKQIRDFGYHKIGSMRIPSQWRVRILTEEGVKGKWIYNDKNNTSYDFSQNNKLIVEIGYNPNYHLK